MTNKATTFLRLHPAICFIFGLAFLGISGVLIARHTETILEVQRVSVPLVADLPRLERTVKVLQQQMEITELHAATRVGSQEEKVHVFSLPEETDMDRLVAVFEVVRETLKRQNMLSHMSDLKFGETVRTDNDLSTTPLEVEFVVHDEGLETVLLLVRLAGLLTVGDTLTQMELDLLLNRIEHESPTGLVALEKFLSTDLLEYTENPRLHEEQLRKAFGTTMFRNAFENVLRTSLLADAKEFLNADLGNVLQTYKLWPLQMMLLREMTIEPGSASGWHRITLHLDVYSAE